MVCAYILEDTSVFDITKPTTHIISSFLEGKQNPKGTLNQIHDSIFRKGKGSFLLLK
jgi:hypothetical protein